MEYSLKILLYYKYFKTLSLVLLEYALKFLVNINKILNAKYYYNIIDHKNVSEYHSLITDRFITHWYNIYIVNRS